MSCVSNSEQAECPSLPPTQSTFLLLLLIVLSLFLCVCVCLHSVLGTWPQTTLLLAQTLTNTHIQTHKASFSVHPHSTSLIVCAVIPFLHGHKHLLKVLYDLPEHRGKTNTLNSKNEYKHTIVYVVIP